MKNWESRRWKLLQDSKHCHNHCKYCCQFLKGTNPARGVPTRSGAYLSCAFHKTGGRRKRMAYEVHSSQRSLNPVSNSYSFPFCLDQHGWLSVRLEGDSIVSSEVFHTLPVIKKTMNNKRTQENNKRKQSNSFLKIKECLFKNMIGYREAKRKEWCNLIAFAKDSNVIQNVRDGKYFPLHPLWCNFWGIAYNITSIII